MIFYQLSGPSDEKIGFDPQTLSALKDDLPSLKHVAVIASNPRDYETTDNYFNRHRHWFEALSNHPITYEIIDYRRTKDHSHELIKRAQLVHFMGGDPIIERDFLIEYELHRCELFEHKVLLGTSAGAMLMGPEIIFSEDSVNSYEGLGWVPTSVIPHMPLPLPESFISTYTTTHPLILLKDDGGVRHDGISIKHFNETQTK